MSFKHADVSNEYQKNKDLKPEDVKQLQNWIYMQPHLPKLSELQAILFLQSCYYSNEAAKIALDKFYTIRTLCTDIFSNRDTKCPSVREAMDTMIMVIFPKVTSKNYRIFYTKFMNFDAHKFTFGHQIRQFDMTLTLDLHLNGTAEGHLILFDFSGITLAHLTKLNLINMKKLFYYLQEAVPIRLQGLHYINPGPFMDKILALMKPFMKKELYKMLHIHNKVEDVFEFIPLECLPLDYGGKCEPITVLHEKNIRHVLDNSNFYDEERKLVVDESKGPGKPRTIGDYLGIEGTFKTLQID